MNSLDEFIIIIVHVMMFLRFTFRLISDVNIFLHPLLCLVLYIAVVFHGE